MTTRYFRLTALDWLGTFAGLGLATLGCSSSGPVNGPVIPVGATSAPHIYPAEAAEEFVSNAGSDVQRESEVNGSAASPPAAASAGTPGAVTDASSGPSDPSRTITEADIIQVEGDTLYALSEYSGLTLVDIKDPTRLRTLGNHRVGGTPFEMYRNKATTILMFNGYGHYAYDEDAGVSGWVTSSHVQLANAHDPAHIQVLADLDVPGTISDSRLVGDVLYLVTTEDAGCWDCSTGPSTVVTSFDLSSPTHIAQVDQLRFEEPADSYIGPRSITVNEQRIYMGGYDWHYNGVDGQGQGSSIQVVDIADPTGKLATGANIHVAGDIRSRWQMDESEGVLRVISQWQDWFNGHAPQLQTFTVTSSQHLEALATIDIQLPEPENLDAVRFDGVRAYAITSRRTDPLFTFDLSDPANPRQMGELVMPGSVYHMEPRGNRIYAIGFEQGNAAGGLHMSLFDVEDLAEPKLLSRVNFGGSWGSFAEDQDRIQKSFRLLDDQGFAVLPFSGSLDTNAQGCSWEYQSGIQLIDYTRDTLQLRGMAPQLGEARRALVHNNALFGIGDNAVQSFDIADRDNIKKLATVETARNVSSVKLVGDKVLRYGSDWWTNRAVLDVTDLAHVSLAQSGTELDLSAFAATSRACNASGYWGSTYVHGSYAYIERYDYEYNYSDGTDTSRLSFLVVDLSGEKPVALGTFGPGALISGNRQIDGQEVYFSSSFAGVVQTENALLVGKRTYNWDANGLTRHSEQSYEVFDLRSPEAPVTRGNVTVPESLVTWGWGGFMGMCGIDMGWGWGGYYRGYYNGAPTVLVSGSLIASSHAEPVPGDEARVKYYLDRIDFTDPANPVTLEPVNVPGRVVDFQAETGRVLTMEEITEALELTQTQCEELSQVSPGVRVNYVQNADGTDYTVSCEKYENRLNLVQLLTHGARKLNSVVLDSDEWRLSATAITSERVFVKQQNFRTSTYTYNGTEYSYLETESERMTAFDANLSQLGTTDEQPASWSDLRARGKLAFSSDTGSLAVYDATDPSQLATRKLDLLGYGCDDLEVRGNNAVCSHGMQGVEVLKVK